MSAYETIQNAVVELTDILLSAGVNTLIIDSEIDTYIIKWNGFVDEQAAKIFAEGISEIKKNIESI